MGNKQYPHFHKEQNKAANTFVEINKSMQIDQKYEHSFESEQEVSKRSSKNSHSSKISNKVKTFSVKQGYQMLQFQYLQGHKDHP